MEIDLPRVLSVHGWPAAGITPAVVRTQLRRGQWRRIGARSPAEARAVDRLRRGPVPAFEVNVPIVDATGQVVAVADLLWRELRAVLEVDSREFHFDESGWKQTMQRHNRLTRLGLALVHHPPSAVAEPGWPLEVSAWLRARAIELGVPRRPAGGIVRGGRPFLV